MADGTLTRIAGPGYLPLSPTNIYTPPASTMFVTINQIHVVNTTASTESFSLFIGASGGSAGGTEIESSYQVPAHKDWQRSFFPGLRMASTDFFSGNASAASALTITIMGTQSVV